MKIAIISDIHGNLEALREAFSNIEKRKADTVICLGDLVGYGPYPNEVVEFIREKRILNILGNYDAAVLEKKFNYIRNNRINEFCMPWTAGELKEENRAYLKSLPGEIDLQFLDKKICFVHGSTRSINEYLLENSREASEVMETFAGDVLVCAHTHIPCESRYGSKILINDGSIGKPKIGRPNGTYVLMDVKDGGVYAELVEFTYDYEKTAAAMEQKGIIKACIDNIRTGME
ncbi:metallophosphoesterase family protein [Clostridium sp. MT-14]|uniref:metallophosphoesterase family protein n=1 Tax=Clostridium sp. MT-14 TaxID=3348360 RepID=UPI0035F39E23